MTAFRHNCCMQGYSLQKVGATIVFEKSARKNLNRFKAIGSKTNPKTEPAQAACTAAFFKHEFSCQCVKKASWKAVVQHHLEPFF